MPTNNPTPTAEEVLLALIELRAAFALTLRMSGTPPLGCPSIRHADAIIESYKTALSHPSPDYARGRQDGIEEAAKVADPPLMHRKGKPGLWRIRRAQIAADIRALSAAPAPVGQGVRDAE